MPDIYAMNGDISAAIVLVILGAGAAWVLLGPKGPKNG